jgi:AcrR family transcriptional regulator
MNPENREKRKYDSTLRRHQQELTNEAIMAAVEKLILDGQIHSFTIQRVAEVAGVSYASIYRHFTSREALVQGYRDWGMEQVAPPPPPYVDTLEELLPWVEPAISQMFQYLPRIKAMRAAMSALQINTVHPQSRERDEWIDRLVQEAAPAAPMQIRKAASAIIRLMVSATSWMEFHTRYGLDESEIVTTVTQAIQAQIQYLKPYQQH